METLASIRQSSGASRCLACGKCSTMCPLAGNGDFAVRLIIGQDMQEEMRGRGVGVWRCLSCAACEERCPQGIHFTEFIKGVRALIPDDARRPCPHGGVFQSIAGAQAASGLPPGDLDWLGEDLRVSAEGEVGLFVGCLPYFDAYFSQDLAVRPLDIARAAVRVLNGLGIEPVLVAEERCCGHDLLWRGDRESFESLARANTGAFAARGVKHLLTTCAECCRTWRCDYSEAVPGYAPRVEHLAEFLAAKVAGGEARFRENGGGTSLTYHDPCRLGRHLGVLDEPRAVLGAMPGVEMVEMERAGRDAACCGTCGFTHCDAASRRLQTERLAEARATGAETLVTACPKCLIHFSCAQAESRRRGSEEPSLKIEDFTVLAARLLEGSSEAAAGVPAPSGRATGAT